MSIAELLPSVATLSHTDKLKLMQIILQQLAQEDDAVMLPKQALLISIHAVILE